MASWSDPSWDAATDLRLEQARLAARCDNCRLHPGETSVDGDWLCPACADALDNDKEET